MPLVAISTVQRPVGNIGPTFASRTGFLIPDWRIRPQQTMRFLGLSQYLEFALLRVHPILATSSRTIARVWLSAMHFRHHPVSEELLHGFLQLAHF